jgi:molybdenum cofactor cytidylyltransferase
MSDEPSAAPPRVAAVVLAAGAGSRFGGGKVLAEIGGRPLIAHVVDAARAAALRPIVVVEPPDGSLAGLDLGVVRRVVNRHPEEGLSSSVRLGLRAFLDDMDVEAAVILPADQPRIRSSTIHALLDAMGRRPFTPFIVARHLGDGAPNPVLARRSIWRLADEIAGDRGFGPIVAAHPELVTEIHVEGSNPDVDTAADLRRLLTSANRTDAVS